MPPSRVGGRVDDPRDPLFEPRIGLRQAALFAVVALRDVVGVVAGVRGDEGERRRRRRRPQVGRQAADRLHVRVAVAAVADHRLEVHEAVVAGRVAVAGGVARVGEVGGADRRMAADGAELGHRRPVPLRVLAHVFGVLLPGEALGAHLVADRLDVLRVDAALADQLPVLGPFFEVLAFELDEGSEDFAVLAGLVIGRLAADLGDVVVQAVVTDAVVVAQQRALAGERLRQIRGRGRPAEGVAEGLVLQVDHPDVVDRRLRFGILAATDARMSRATGQGQPDAEGEDRQGGGGEGELRTGHLGTPWGRAEGASIIESRNRSIVEQMLSRSVLLTTILVQCRIVEQDFHQLASS